MYMTALRNSAVINGRGVTCANKMPRRQNSSFCLWLVFIHEILRYPGLLTY